MERMPTVAFLAALWSACALAADEPKKVDEKKVEKKAAGWETAIAKFQEEDAKTPPKAGSTVFVGSSSIRMWKLEQSFPGAVVYNRGFGGSKFPDATKYMDRILAAHKPKNVVIYSGDNDIGGGATAEKAAADGIACIEAARKAAPGARVAIIGVKPSGSRWAKWPVAQAANALLRKYCDGKADLLYLDPAPLMLGSDGMPLPELFLKDRLHMTAEGYRRWTGLVGAALALPIPISADARIAAPSGESIVEPGAKFELLFTRSAPIKGGLTEGPAVAPDGTIYFSDIPMGPDHKGMILRFDPKSGKTTVFTDDSGKSNGMIVDHQGRLVACEGADAFGGRRVVRWDLKTKERTVLTDNFGGKKYNAPNDVCIDIRGRLYFTDPRYVGTEPRELEHRAVYRIDEDGSVHEVTHDVSKPNGIALSRDGKTLYVADHDNGTDRIDPTKPAPKHGPMKILAFPLDAKGAVSGPRVELVDFGDQAGCDGMTVDSAGNLYLTTRGNKRPGVLVVDRTGKEVGFLPTGPADQKAGSDLVGLPSNVEFGLGEDANWLYVTVDVSLYRIKLKSTGWHVQYAR